MGEVGQGTFTHMQIYSMHMLCLPGLSIHPIEVRGVTFSTEMKSPLATVWSEATETTQQSMESVT